MRLKAYPKPYKVSLPSSVGGFLQYSRIYYRGLFFSGSRDVQGEGVTDGRELLTALFLRPNCYTSTIYKAIHCHWSGEDPGWAYQLDRIQH